ncbi:MAG: aminotransferase class I/II-fold pyridoxal phosphate-dependent enzyme [Gemmatimonadetes bacterium]|nr:aminotransferase class I/II-fold pyridoxal phosphate-dependent enzyme [Gemmatimonadota bacterium]
MVDLRSDTVTRPTEAMREAIARAEVGDDALGDDPTVRRLEARVAELLGKERALFFPSGIMANQTALAVLGARGGEVVLDADAHIVHWEEGAAAALSGLQIRPVVGEDGLLDADAVRAAIRSGSPYLPRTALVAVENTHLASGGRIFPVERMEAIAGVAREHGLPVHLDGARLWHAAAETGQDAPAWARHADTVMVTLSKGLGAPVGSLLAGTDEAMTAAWRVRRRFGGGMRQSGILAAAGLHALEHHRDRLREDHERARTLAGAAARLPGVGASRPETNIVLLDISGPPERAASLLSFLDSNRILMLSFGPNRLRAVTHRDVDDAGIARIVDVFEEWGRQGAEY